MTERKGTEARPRWTCWAVNEREHRLRNCESTLATGARHILYEHATFAIPEPGYLPADDRKLAKMAGLTDKEWGEIGPEIVEDWVLTDKGWLVQRINEEMGAAEASKKRRASAGKRGADRRWNDGNAIGKTPESGSNANGNANAKQAQTDSIAIGIANGKTPKTDGSAIANAMPIRESENQEEEEQKKELLRGPETKSEPLDFSDPEPPELFLDSEEEPDPPPRLTEAWDRDALVVAGQAANATAEVFSMRPIDLQRWVVLQRQQLRHPRAVTSALDRAAKLGPTKIRSVKPWLDRAVKAETPNENARDSEGKAAEHREVERDATEAMFGPGTVRR